MASVVIYLNSELFHVDREALYSWFPITAGHARIAGEDLVEDFAAHLHHRYNISHSAFRETLRSLFRCLSVQHLPLHGSTRARVATELTRLLRRDVDGGTTFNWRGLHRSRHAFIILAYVANRSDSVLLAGALFEFWDRCMDEIEQRESPHYRHEWHRALQKIMPLGQSGMFYNPWNMNIDTFAMTFAGQDRGRSARHLPYYRRSNRALSAPATRYRSHSPDNQLIPYTNAMIMHNPGMLSPMHTIQSGSFDDMDVVLLNQHKIMNKINELEQDVAGLGYVSGHGSFW